MKTVKIAQRTYIISYAFLPFDGARSRRFTFGTIQLRFVSKAPQSIPIVLFRFLGFNYCLTGVRIQIETEIVGIVVNLRKVLVDVLRKLEVP